ncbi:MAG: nucleotidyltransferase substrate binding protein [Acidobacteriota bacterium]|jgi:nucleotidyltransferase substrate binding protein (TIGR01987 family)|nr:nucleotidyltransferase substrate binding protein [Acidobacteriota bacterium]
MTNADMRWKQRFANYKKAHNRLKNAAVFFAAKSGCEEEPLAIEALIKCIELSFELAWQTMKDFMSYKGYIKDLYGSRDSIRGAMQFNLIEGDGQPWMDMIDDRNRAARIYDEGVAKHLANRIVDGYCGEFVKFEEKMNSFL